MELNEMFEIHPNLQPMWSSAGPIFRRLLEAYWLLKRDHVRAILYIHNIHGAFVVSRGGAYEVWLDAGSGLGMIEAALSDERKAEELCALVCHIVEEFGARKSA